LELTGGHVIRFLDACGGDLPRLYYLVQMMINAYYGIRVDFSPFVGEMKNIFRSASLKALEHAGLPVQISEKLYEVGDSPGDLASRLDREARARNQIFGAFERDWIISALAPGAGARKVS
jgi:hypothetical protein